LAGYFFDTSALAKFYHPELGTPEVDEIMKAVGARIRISRLTVVELSSVFAIKVRTQFISREDARLFLRQFREDVVSRRFEVFGVGESEFALAERLVEQYAFEMRLRALDAVQLAVALGLRRQGLIDRLVAADKTLCEVAALEGFSVFNPEHPIP
jgi:predicted nucleic acid-binding protein